MYMCMYVCICKCIHVCILVCIYMICVYMHISVYVCIYVISKYSKYMFPLIIIKHLMELGYKQDFCILFQPSQITI